MEKKFRSFWGGIEDMKKSFEIYWSLESTIFEIPKKELSHKQNIAG